MNLSKVPDKLPVFMMKYGNDMIDSYFDADYELMESDPDMLCKVYRLTNSGEYDSYAYIDSVENRILEAFSYKFDPDLVEKLCSDQKAFMQAIKAVPSNLLLTDLYYRAAKDASVPKFEDFTVYDFAVALNYITLLVCMKNRESEIEEHCDAINDFMEKTNTVNNNFNYESFHRTKRRTTKDY